jgi:hypothetical protein
VFVASDKQQNLQGKGNFCGVLGGTPEQEKAAKKSAASNKAAEKAETISVEMPYLGVLVPVVLLSLEPFLAFLAL